MIGVKLQVLAYRTPPPRNPQDPDDSRSYNYTTVEQVSYHSTTLNFAVVFQH